MIRLNVHQAKTHLSKYLDRLAKGETILLCKRNTPVAEIRAVAAAENQAADRPRKGPGQNRKIFLQAVAGRIARCL
jgi:antitoxin (DNA-binding transcriptional repressor) of toxin-antitoxin stability system